jgi:hypothetical protein
MTEDEYAKACAVMIGRYPQVFGAYRTIPLPIGPGWLPLVAAFATEAAQVLEQNAGYSIRILQIKEKFSSLVIYFSMNKDGRSAEMSDPVFTNLCHYTNEVYDQSNTICEQCGDRGTRRNPGRKGGWWMTLCDLHVGYPRIYNSARAAPDFDAWSRRASNVLSDLGLSPDDITDEETANRIMIFLSEARTMLSWCDAISTTRSALRFLLKVSVRDYELLREEGETDEEYDRRKSIINAILDASDH